MKICLINSLYPPFNRGGAETVTEAVAQGFKKQGHEVAVITLGRENKVEAVAGVKVYRLKPVNIFSFIDINDQPAWLRLPWHFFDMFNFLAARRVKRILAEEKPDLAVAHNLKGLGYLIPRAIKRLGLRYIQVVHDVQLVVPTGLLIVGRESLEKNILCRIYAAINRWLFGSPAVVISPSRWLMDFYTTRGFFSNSEKKVLLNPSLEVLADVSSGKVFNPQKINFLYISQIEEHKGILFLVSILKKLANNNWQFQIIGDGKKMGELKKMVGEDSRFVIYGSKYGEELIPFLKSPDFTLVPTFCYENLPQTILESFSFGVPVIAADIGGIPELVEDNKNGFLFKAGDEKNLQAVLEKVLAIKIDDYNRLVEGVRGWQGLNIEDYIREILRC